MKAAAILQKHLRHAIEYLVNLTTKSMRYRSQLCVCRVQEFQQALPEFSLCPSRISLSISNRKFSPSAVSDPLGKCSIDILTAGQFPAGN